jgi:catechol 2,3-dioxygenase-like lactoylglutathione lyase family enzyme
MIDLNLLVLRCRDIEEAKRFYELIGLRFSKHAHGSGPEHYAHEDERGVFELYPAKPGSADTVGLGFRALNLEDAHRAFAESGYKAGEIRETEWGRSFVVRDPDQRRVEIKQK